MISRSVYPAHRQRKYARRTAPRLWDPVHWTYSLPPAVVAYMEMAACYAVNDLLEEGLSTVGTKIDIAHIKASPIGETITAKATLKEIDGRRLVFDVTASDSKGEIANGTHERFIIKVDKFLAKLQ